MEFYKFILALLVASSTGYLSSKQHAPRIGIICDCPDAIELTAQLVAYGKELIAIDGNNWVTNSIYNHNVTHNNLYTRNILNEGIYQNNLAIIPDFEQGIELCDIILYVNDPNQSINQSIWESLITSKTMVCITRTTPDNTYLTASQPDHFAQITIPEYDFNSIYITSSSNLLTTLLAKLFFPLPCIAI